MSDNDKDLTLSPEEITQRLRTGWQLSPNTPGLKEAARALIRPVIEQMRGQEIIYCCRFNWLLRVTSLEVDDEGFRAVGTPAQEPPDDLLSQFLTQPLSFSAKWIALHMRGKAVSMAMVPDCFWPDADVVAAIKAAAAKAPGNDAPIAQRKAVWAEMREILDKASAKA